MGEDPERIEREIERTRAKLGEDLDALEEKINPKKVAHRSVERAKEKVAEVKDKVVGAANGQSGAGVGDKVAGLAGTAREKAAPLAATAKEKVGPLAATAKDKVAPLAATAKDKAAARAGLDPQTADTREVATVVAGNAWQTLLEQTRRNPVAVGAAAFLLGVLLGR
ncbi:MAG: DUF3618 domain-containing protein [Mycobacteriales bacterium]